MDMRLVGLVSLLLVFAGTASGTGPSPSDTGPHSNAALRYWRIFAVMDPKTEELLRTVNAGSLGDAGWRPTPEQIEVAATVRADLFERASTLPKCDYELDIRKDGMLTLMPHLGPMRTTVKAMLVSARVDMEQGRIDAAVGRIAACLRAAGQTNSDDAILQAMVRRAMFMLVDPVLTLAAPKLTASHKQELRQALQAFPEDDPFGIITATKTEGDLTAHWIESVIKQGDGEALNTLFVQLKLSDEHQQLARDLVADPVRTAHEVERLAALFEQGIGAMTDPHPREAVATIELRASRNEFGSMAGYFMPDFGGLGEKLIESRSMLAGAKQRVAP